VSKNPLRNGPWLAVAALSLGALPAQAQNVAYLTMDYMHVAPAKVQAYLDLEQKTWKPFHQALVAAGKRLVWTLFEVQSPSGSQAPYNFVTVATYAKFADMADPYPSELVTKAFPGKDPNAIGAQAAAVRDLVRSETWRVLDNVHSDAKPWPRQYVVVNFMKVADDNVTDYLAYEQKVWKPIHTSRVADGLAEGWGLNGLRFPGGSSQPYNFATADWYDKFADLENPFTLAMAKKAYPGLDDAALESLLNRTGALREVVRSEVWHLVDTTALGSR